MRPIRFFHQGRVVEIDDASPTRTVLDWLRVDARCTGTKEGCNEGDCGACTVVVGRLAPQQGGDTLALQTVNACLQTLPMLDGQALFTVHDLRAIAAETPSQESATGAATATTLHPVQRAMVDAHGSQCGFCTPGFVMSLWAEYEAHRQSGTRPDRQALADALSGNLCRCTGYRPILDAGERMFDLPPAPLSRAPVVTALQRLRDQAAADDGADGFAYRPMRPRPDDAAQAFHAPRTLAALAKLVDRHPDARLLAGNTDVGLWVNKQFRRLGTVIWTGAVEALRRLDEDDDDLRIGAAVSLEDAWAAIASRIDGIDDIWLRFASPPIRHAGTMGGNLANGSPIGDSAPILLALDAALELRRGERTRRLPLADFYLDYMKNALLPGEFIEAVRIPLAALSRTVRGYKVSKRFDSDISAVCAGLSIAVDGDRVVDARFAFGGMAAIVRRASAAEAAVQGQPWTAATVADAQAALARDFSPMTDLRASAAYRLRVAQNLLQRLWLETRQDAPLAPSATRVWSLRRSAG